MDNYGVHKPVGAESKVDARIHGAVGVEARQAVARDATGLGKGTADQDAELGIQRQSLHVVIASHADIEIGVRGAVDVQTGDIIEIAAVDAGEQAADEYPSIWLHHNGSDGPIDVGRNAVKSGEVGV